MPVTEHAGFDIGADAYNLLNHTNLAVQRHVGAAGFGLITSTVSCRPASTALDREPSSERMFVVFGKFLF
ncbi:MAG: hypothetical protein ACRYGF_06450 [Janthinobacterium lividum]